MTSVPEASSDLVGDVESGYALTKCETKPQRVDVLGRDADGNFIIGPGAPTPTLTSDDGAHLAVATPSPSSPNRFSLTRPAIPKANTTVHLTAAITPAAGAGATKVSANIAVSFNADICGVITEFTTGISFAPDRIVEGSDGNLWFTELVGCCSKFGKISTDGAVTEYPYLATNSPATAIAWGPDNNLWFTEGGSCNCVVKITTAGTLTQYSSGITSSAGLQGIAAGPDGNLWFAECLSKKIGTITTGGTVTEYSTGISDEPYAIAKGPDDKLWFTEASAIGKITTGGTVTEYSGFTRPPSWSIVSGADGNMWFTEGFNPTIGNTVGKITLDGHVTEYSSGITDGSAPHFMSIGPDGNLWFGEFDYTLVVKYIAKITTGGMVTEFPIAGNAPVWSITEGSEGNLWFTEESTPAIFRLQ